MFASVIPLITLISINEAFAQSCLRYYYDNNKKKYMFVLAVFFYSIVAYCIFLAYKFKGVGMVNALWSGMSVLLMILVGIFLFKENVSLIEGVGVVLILSGIICINLKK